MRIKKTKLLCLLILWLAHGQAQTDTQFWFVAPNVDPNGANFNVPIVVRMTSFSAPATITISIPANPSFTPIVNTIAANSTITVDLSAWLSLIQNGPSNNILNKGILIQSTSNITAYYEVVSSYCNCNPEVFSLKGKNALGNEFYVSSQYTYNIDTIRQPAATTSFDIVATEDNTNVTITPTKDIVGHPANIPFSIVLNRGQTYSAEGIYRDLNSHLEGSYVLSDKPIAMTLKDDLVFGDGPCADLIGDQTVPTSVLGNEYIISKGFLVPMDRVFVMAIADNTAIFLDGSTTPSVTLNKGQSWTFTLSNPSTYIESDKKFYTYHVTGNGCELGSAIIPKLNCTGSTAVSIVRSSSDIFAVMLITQNGNQGNFTVNGSTAVISPGNFAPVPGTGGNYVAGTIDLSGYSVAGSVLNVTNTAGKFGMGFINGAAGGGSRYGFFSDFKSSNVQTTQSEICQNDSTQLTAFGGVTYQWSPAAGLNQTNIAAPKASPSGTTKYTVIITDAQGCVDSAFVNVVVDTLPKSDFTFNQDVCNPLKVSFSGASQPNLTYNWNIAGAPYSTDPNPVYTFTQPGSYPVTLTVSTAIGCSSTSAKNIPVDFQTADIISTADTTICSGSSKQILTKPSLEFCWSPTTYLDNPSSANPTATPPVSTKYYFTSKTTGINLIINGDFSAGNSGFSSDYQYSGSGVPPAVYTVGNNPTSWNPGMSSCKDHTTGSGNMMLVNGSQQLNAKIWSENIVVQPNTNYSFSAWLQSISSISPAVLQFSINGVPLGDTLNANANTCIWNQFYTTWNSGSSSNAVISIVNLNANYSGNDFALDDISFAPLSVQRDSVTISVETPAVLASNDTSICPGSPAQLAVTGSLNYNWSPGKSLSDSSISGPVAMPAINTSYIVTGTSARGCVAKDTVNITLFAPPPVAMTPDTGICTGSTAQLYASGGLTYNWAPAQYLSNPGSPNPIAQPPSATKFTVTITDGRGCTNKDSVTVSILPAPLFKAPPDQSVCKGSAILLSNGGNGNKYRYSWSPATSLNDPAAPTPQAQPQETTLYTLLISDSVCQDYDSSFTIELAVIPTPEVLAQKANDIDCAITISQLSATGAADYLWAPEEGLDNPRIPNPIASIDSTTTFIVRGTAENGCSAFDTLTVKVTATGHNLFVVPNAFTPNGDGHNDCFGIRRWGDVRIEEFSIYNRWGGRVFTTRNPSDCWDGTFNGQPQEAGGYVYIIRAWSFCGEITRKGVLTLVR